MSRDFSPAEERALALLQADLPDTATPFADVARLSGLGESRVLALVEEMKASGAIRRFGATLRHQKAGYGHNAMVAWIIDPADMDRVGPLMAARPEISHCYERITHPQWPYNLYTMVHGKNPDDCLRLAQSLAELADGAEFAVLESIKELKKTSMAYFTTEEAR